MSRKNHSHSRSSGRQSYIPSNFPGLAPICREAEPSSEDEVSVSRSSMTQHSLDQEFHRMQLHDPRSKQLSPPIARKPQPQVYRQGPAMYRGYGDTEDFPPPPPPPTFPPPPPDMKENIYHEIQDDSFPPPPPNAPPHGDYRQDHMHMRNQGHTHVAYGSAPVAQFESRHESSTVIQPSGRYEREVKQALYSVQSSDSSGRSSPYSSQYANLNTYSTSTSLANPYSSAPVSQSSPYSSAPVSQSSPYSSAPVSQSNLYSSSPVSQSNPYSSAPVSQNYAYNSSSQYGQYPTGPTHSRYSPVPASSSIRQTEESGVTYAHIAPKSESNVTYAQIQPRSDRPVPGPQVPVQIKVGGTTSEPYLTTSQVSSPSMRSPQSPPSQHYVSSPMYSSSHSPKVSKEPQGLNSKEQEVDALTQMLMQGLEGSKDPDFFGMCAKCGKKVLGDNNGCTAMDQIYHIACFICVGCGTLLRGKSFYAMERKPYCESCYVNTLERCSICSKPITDRLLRATGKPYHPACFTCVVCGKSLDGVPFTVDATNQIHCIEDFHKKFAPRCCVCHHPIMPDKGQEETVRVVAMDRSFHVHCYRCEDCNLQLSSEAEGRGCYPLDDHILCKNCNAKRINALTTKLSTEL